MREENKVDEKLLDSNESNNKPLDKKQVEQIVKEFYFSGGWMNVVSDPLEFLKTAKTAFIKQSIELFEIMSSCTAQNKYNVYTKDDQGQPTYLFVCNEESGFLARNCLKGDWRPLIMRVKHVVGKESITEDFLDSEFSFERPFKCSCCGCSKAIMSGVDKNGNVFGSLVEPSTCLDFKCNVRDKDENIKYKIIGDYCQWGIACKWNCLGKCANAMFYIYSADTDADDCTPEKCVGKIEKLSDDVVKAYYTDLNSFMIKFPEDATSYDKLMLIGVSLMIDYRFYEECPTNKKDYDEIKKKYDGAKETGEKAEKGFDKLKSLF